MKEIFPYKKSIDSKVVKAASEILGVPVISSSRLKGGVVNYVYKLKTAERTVVVKVFRNRFWPEDGKLQWIEKQFAKHKVPHAKMIYYSRNNKYFLFGLMISEYVAGLNAMEAVKKGVHTMADSYKATGNLLKRVHKIKLKKFGQINYGKGTDSNFINRELKKATGLIEKLIHHKNLKHEILNKFISAVRNGLEPFKKRLRFPSVIVAECRPMRGPPPRHLPIESAKPLAGVEELGIQFIPCLDLMICQVGKDRRP